ncbi:fibrinogen C domain-containing protein 1-like [Gigantopelta aegis]|uniref:fibrinogen C domain-containing protein 1-like n=1 Tax=Gigantopelta aegis TaxID=1735272 RepID=UPI001B88BEBC|nr:fibrinogen C domain-containing protein 1-like [Gigantopelta aegis]
MSSILVVGEEAVFDVPSDCYDVVLSSEVNSGVYTIIPRDSDAPINVSCESAFHDQGWLVIQRRTDGSENFYRTWNEYRDGFGDLNNEFWLGNTNIHRITSQGYYDLRIDLEDFEGNTSYAMYTNFSLASEQEYFRLSLGEYSGDAGDGLGKHNGQRFSAKDKDLDVDPGKSCAQRYKGGWWYKSCHSSNLNGQYLNGTHSSFANGVNWKYWLGNYYSLKRTVMKIRPMKF